MGFWDWVLIAVVLFLSFALGVFGFYNIIGSIRIRKYRGTALTLVTVVIWSAILFGAWFLVHRFLSQYQVAFYIGAGVGLLKSLRAGKNGPEE